jgi:hypothetical protein
VITKLILEILNFLGIIYLKCQNDQLFDLLHPLIGWGGGGGFWNFFVFLVKIRLILPFFGDFNPNIYIPKKLFLILKNVDCIYLFCGPFLKISFYDF